MKIKLAVTVVGLAFLNACSNQTNWASLDKVQVNPIELNNALEVCQYKQAKRSASELTLKAATTGVKKTKVNYLEKEGDRFAEQKNLEKYQDSRASFNEDSKMYAYNKQSITQVKESLKCMKKHSFVLAKN
ncbi:hypothetical protein [Paraferrimonas sp. SM1919]|uniref:hypothetical protein n=1 Tax=Paraferrimonas sp. SM1919 TaxID=2662263 RepID=UPI0013D00012|nr:hypothetical protein [Paraferrimonas sp. SM1919]